MPDDTTILSLPLILPAQAQKHVTHNEALARLDLIVQLAVINRVLTAAPALPALGDRYIVAAGAMGAWVGQSDRIALYGEAGWQFTLPLPGWQAHVLSEGQTAVYDGVAWATLADGPLVVTELGVSASPDATNRLSVSSPATLLNHAGAGHRLKLNKAAAGDTASLLFQTGFSGRAEMGTAGTDDFSVKVSADGTAWAVALAADAATGEVTLPEPLHFGGQASDPVAAPDGTLWLNTTTGEVKVRSAGAVVAIGGGGVADGDKGDITVSGSGATWTIDAGAVTLAKLANIATDSFLGRDTAGTGAPEVLSPAAAKAILAIAAADVTGLAAIASSGSASDLTTGTLPAARFDDTAHGARAGGTLHANAVAGGAAGFMTGTDKTKLDGVASGATAYTDEAAQDAVGGMVDGSLTYVDATPLLQRAALTGAVTAAAGSNATALGSFTKAALDAAVSDGNVLYVGDVTTNATHTGDATGATALTLATVNSNVGAFGSATQVPTFTTNAKGLTTAAANVAIAIPASAVTDFAEAVDDRVSGLVVAGTNVTITYNDAAGTLTFAAAGAAGSTGEVQYNNGGGFAGAADVEIEGGQLRLPYISTPATPAAGGLKLYGMDFGPGAPAFLLPGGKVRLIQSDLGDFNVNRFTPGVGSSSLVLESSLNLGVFGGVATAASPAVADLHRMMPRLDILDTTADAANIAGWRNALGSSVFLRVGRDANAPGGFHSRTLWAPATGGTVATHRAFVGVAAGWASVPTDVEPSTRTNIIGMGWDAADTNIQFMHNSGAGVATKIDLGAGFPVPTTDRPAPYEIQLYSPNDLTQSVSYRVIRYNTTDKTIAAETSGTVTTNLPAVTTLMATVGAMSVGGTSSVIGVALMGILVAREY